MAGVLLLESRCNGGNGDRQICDINVEITCFPVHNSTGFKMVGLGIIIGSTDVHTSEPGSPVTATYTNCLKSALVKNVFFCVSLTALATWSCNRPRMGLPLVGTMYCWSVLHT